MSPQQLCNMLLLLQLSLKLTKGRELAFHTYSGVCLLLKQSLCICMSCIGICMFLIFNTNVIVSPECFCVIVERECAHVCVPTCVYVFFFSFFFFFKAAGAAADVAC